MTADLSKHRQFLEISIISNAILIPADGVQAVELLEPSHFKGKVNRDLFKALQHCHTQGKIFPQDVILAYYAKPDAMSPVEICTYLDMGLFPSNTFRLCLSLIECTMREAFAKLLMEKARAAVKSGQHEEAEMYDTCADRLSSLAHDIFDTVPLVREYLEQYVPDELEDYRELEAKIPKMIRRVKSQDKTKRLIDSFDKLANGQSLSEDRKQAATLLKDLLLMTLGNFKLPPDFFQKINHLKQTLWEPLKSDPSMTF